MPFANERRLAVADIRLSPTAVADWRRCPRYYRHRWIDKLVPIGGSGRALAFGRAFHEAQAVWWHGDNSGDAVARLESARDAFQRASEGKLSQADQLLGQVLLTGYAATWHDQGMLQIEPIVERKVTCPVYAPDGSAAPGLTMVAVFDVVAYNEQYSTVLVEHKTTRQSVAPDSRYWTGIDLHLQASMYYIAANELGRQVGHVLLDVVRAPELELELSTPPEKRAFRKRNDRWGKAGDPLPGTRLADETPTEFVRRVESLVLSAPEQYYARRPLERSDDELDRVRLDVYATGREIQFALDTDLFPRNTNACHAWNRECEYLPICNGTTTAADERLYTVRRTEDKEPWEL